MKKDKIKKVIFRVQKSTKTKRNRKVPINNAALYYLEKHYEQTDYKKQNDFVVATLTGNNSTPKNIQDSIGYILNHVEDTADYEIRVEDTGIGMSQDFVKHIFSPFERERTSTVSKTQGTGLGMAITKNIIDLMGGTIDVKTEQGRGTSFIIRLPFPLEEGRDEETGASESSSADYHFEGTRVLLVEDNPVNMEIACMILNHAGFDRCRDILQSPSTRKK